MIPNVTFNYPHKQFICNRHSQINKTIYIFTFNNAIKLITILINGIIVFY
jgi:hypothetical protein